MSDCLDAISQLGLPRKNGSQARHGKPKQPMRMGNFDARQRMIEANLRLVVSIAKHYQHRGVALDDQRMSYMGVTRDVALRSH